jgi:DNA replication protein DnaC
VIQRMIDAIGLDDALPHFAAMIAKASTGEVADGKGFCIQGETGCGKTARLMLMSSWLSIRMVTAREMVERIRQDNTPMLLKEIARTDVCRLDVVPDRYYDIAIDDLGFEAERSSTYGNVRDIMEDVLTERYKVFPRWKTHITTNLTGQQLLQRYGDRIYSRLCEMCHFVTMGNGDRRREAK